MRKAVPSYGSDFRGVRVILHRSQESKRGLAESVVPGASVSIAENDAAWGAAVVAGTHEAHNRLGFFWDAGYTSAKECLKEAGIETEWIDA